MFTLVNLLDTLHCLTSEDQFSFQKMQTINCFNLCNKPICHTSDLIIKTSKQIGLDEREGLKKNYKILFNSFSGYNKPQRERVN